MTLWIDPPSGWKYGFPKSYTKPDEQSLESWMLEQGYPQHEIDWGALKYCRFSGTEEELDALIKDDPNELYTSDVEP